PRGPKAQAPTRLHSVTGAHVDSIEVDSAGRATGVKYVRGSEEFFQPASVVLVATYTYENVRLLLLSKSKAFPNGLSNNHGQVGKHYIGHWAGRGGCVGLFPSKLNLWYGAMAQGISLSNWAEDNFDHSGLGFIGGGSLLLN